MRQRSKSSKQARMARTCRWKRRWVWRGSETWGGRLLQLATELRQVVGLLVGLTGALVLALWQSRSASAVVGRNNMGELHQRRPPRPVQASERRPPPASPFLVVMRPAPWPTLPPHLPKARRTARLWTWRRLIPCRPQSPLLPLVPPSLRCSLPSRSTLVAHQHAYSRHGAITSRSRCWGSTDPAAYRVSSRCTSPR